MGWNPWNTYGCNISEEILLSTAEQLINLGLLEAGYNYVNSINPSRMLTKIRSV